MQKCHPAVCLYPEEAEREAAAVANRLPMNGSTEWNGATGNLPDSYYFLISLDESSVLVFKKNLRYAIIISPQKRKVRGVF